MANTKLVKWAMLIMLMGIMVTGYGGWCKKDKETVSRRRTPTPTAPVQVTTPTPANSATNVSITQQLTWASASGATSYNVYFGITSTGWSAITNTTGTTYNPGTLTNGTLYDWRIDAVNSAGTTSSLVWSFTTIVAPPAQVASPTPSNGATDRPINQQISWASASGATSYDVYFGTSSPGTFIGNQSGTSYSPALANSTPYYWRIDSKNVGGTTTGLVWSFQATAPWQQVACGHAHTLAVKPDGTLWAWGG